MKIFIFPISNTVFSIVIMHQSYDLITTTLEHVDHHLAIALLDTIQSHGTQYDEESLVTAQYALCKGTQLYSDLSDLSEDVVPQADLQEVQNKIKANQQALAAERERLLKGEGVSKFKSFLSNDENKLRYEKMCDDQSIAIRGLEVFDLKEENLKELYSFAHSVYQYGQYGECRSILQFLSQVKPAQYRMDEKRMWGQLACEVLCAKNGIDGIKWQDAVRSLNFIVESAGTSKQHISTIKTCLHWGLFSHLLSQVPNGREELLDIFLSEKCFPVLFSYAQHLMRYVILCLLTTRGICIRGNVHGHPAIREIAKVLRDINFVYSDPVVELFISMFVTFDADKAVAILPSAGDVLATDIFTQAYCDEFLSAARQQICEDHCKGLSQVHIGRMTEKLGIPSFESEKWAVKVLESSKLNEVITEGDGQVSFVSERNAHNVSEIIADKVKAIATRIEGLMMCNS